MNRSHSPLEPEEEEEERYTKVKVVPQVSPGSRKIIANLQKEIKVLQKSTECQDVEVKKAKKDLDRKQRELEESIEEVLNWAPKAMLDTQKKHDSTYRLLRQTSFQLMECQRKLNIPMSLNFDESSSTNKSLNDVDTEITDISLLLARELVQSKESYEHEIKILNERVASLEDQLAESKALHASCSNSGSSLGPQGERAEGFKRLSRVGTVASPTPHSGITDTKEKEELKVDNDRAKEARALRKVSPPLSDHLEKTIAPVKASTSTMAQTLPLISGDTMYPLTIPQDAKGTPWFQKAFKFLNINLSGPYTALINRWASLEKINGWNNKISGLNKSNRPEEVTTWIDARRYGKKQIIIAPEKASEFAERVWMWWVYLQPEWREIVKDRRPLPVKQFGDDWKSLDHFGANGWLSLLACLKWWGESIARIDEPERKERVDDWLLAIDDMSNMLDGLIVYKQT